MKDLATITMGLWAGMLAASAGVGAAEPTEHDPASFKGVISTTAQQSKPHWPARTQAPKGVPNVLIWIMDDAGFAHLRSYGGLIDTPVTDNLAQEGLRFTNFHTTALCSPTRAALLTGRNSHAVSVGFHAAAATGYPGYWSRVPKSAATIAKILQGNGYTTYALGKWDHLPNEDVSPVGPFTYWPSGQGFDHFYGFLAADMDHYHPLLWNDQSPVDPWRGKPDYYLTTDLADHAIQWIETQKATTPDRPFFMYWATGAVHAPHHALKSAIEKYRGRFDMGWDKAREMILANQKKLGVVPADTQLPARPEGLPAWDSLSPEHKKLAARQMEAFAAELDLADHDFGRIVDTLKKTGQYENTIIVVLSDNGASGEGGPEGTFNQTLMFNGLLSSFDQGRQFFDSWGGPGTHPHYSAAWGQAGNTPFKYYKQTVHEGGTRDPLIISWPKGIAAGGGLRGQFHHVNDITPTLLDLIGIASPKEVDGVAQQRVDGISMRYTFGDPEVPTKKGPQYFEMRGNRGVWADGWMAVVAHNTEPWTVSTGAKPVQGNEPWELYDLNHDFNELHDLAASKPEKLAEMKKLFDVEAKRNNVYPLYPDMVQQRREDVQALLQRTQGVFEYFGTERRIHERLSLPILNRSYSIRAEIRTAGELGEGAIVAMGGDMGGYALYVHEGVPAFVYNYFGLNRYVVRSATPLPTGPATLRFEFRKTGAHAGHGTLYLNDAKVGEGEITHTEPVFHSINETFDIGRDDGTSVTPDYAGKDVFTGTIERVLVKVDIAN